MTWLVFSAYPISTCHAKGWKVISLLGKHRRTVVGLTSLVLIAAALDIAVPFLTRGVIDEVLHSLQAGQNWSMLPLIVAALAIFAATATTPLLRSF